MSGRGTVVPGRVARGAAGAGPVRRAYRHSPLRHLRRVTLTHRGLRPDDVLIASYPRSGNAWVAFIVLELVGRQATFDSVRFEAPICGAHASAPSLVPGGGRFIKTHEPYQGVYRRAIHLVRDPRDVCLSYFRFMERDGDLVFRPGDDPDATFDAYVKAFIRGTLIPQGSWQEHLRSWLAADQEKKAHILRLRYEDMRADPAAHVAKIGAWLGLEVSLQRAGEVAERCSLERMREDEKRWDPSVFGSPRTDIAYVGPASLGGWHEALTEEQQRRFRAWAPEINAMGYEPPI